jgi:hypothetical protein
VGARSQAPLAHGFSQSARAAFGVVKPQSMLASEAARIRVFIFVGSFQIGQIRPPIRARL